MTTTKPRWTEEPLSRAEGMGSSRPLKRYEYYVTGRGPFPFDMLRFDRCWPADTDSALKMAPDWSVNPVAGAPPELMKHRSIRLRSYQEPTPERWSSFLWGCGTEKL